MSERPSLDDYVDVATRIADFRAKYPDGYLAPADESHPYRIEQVSGTDRDGNPVTQTFIVYMAAAYRSPGDESPGIGMAWEIFPGRTPYTRGSELMNAETSAWGRAIIALGASDSKQGIASREEVRNRAAEQADPKPPYEERVAAGRMDREQMREHGKLQRDTLAGRPMERVTGPAPDSAQWETPPEDQPGSSNEDQHRAMGMLFKKAGVHADDARHAAIAQVLNLDIIPASSKELSHNQAAKVLRELQAIISAEKKGT